MDDAELFYLRDSEQFHLRMVYEAFNEALNFIRPYGIRGSPYPWKSNPLKVYAHSTDAQNIEKAMVMILHLFYVRDSPYPRC